LELIWSYWSWFEVIGVDLKLLELIWSYWSWFEVIGVDLKLLELIWSYWSWFKVIRIFWNLLRNFQFYLNYLSPFSRTYFIFWDWFDFMWVSWNCLAFTGFYLNFWICFNVPKFNYWTICVSRYLQYLLSWNFILFFPDFMLFFFDFKVAVDKKPRVQLGVLTNYFIKPPTLAHHWRFIITSLGTLATLWAPGSQCRQLLASTTLSIFHNS
jgi:hypothetical protein